MLLHQSVATPEPYCWDDETELPQRERRIIPGGGLVTAVALVAACAAIAIFIRWLA